MEQREIRGKNKGGRPKVAIKKDQMIPVKCSSMEKIILKRKAKAVGLTASEFLRKLGLEMCSIKTGQKFWITTTALAV